MDFCPCVSTENLILIYLSLDFGLFLYMNTDIGRKKVLQDSIPINHLDVSIDSAQNKKF